METRLRMLLLLAGLPRPEVQVSICGDQGRFLGRPDLLCRRQRLALEYEGGIYRDRMVEDNRRQNGLVGASYRMLRFTAADVYFSRDPRTSQPCWRLLEGRHINLQQLLRRVPPRKFAGRLAQLWLADAIRGDVLRQPQ